MTLQSKKNPIPDRKKSASDEISLAYPIRERLDDDSRPHD